MPLSPVAQPSLPSIRQENGISRKVPSDLESARKALISLCMCSDANHSIQDSTQRQVGWSRTTHLAASSLWRHSKLTYVWEQFLFHYISEGGFTYLVMADDSAGRCVQLALVWFVSHSRCYTGECRSHSWRISKERCAPLYFCFRVLGTPIPDPASTKSDSSQPSTNCIQDLGGQRGLVFFFRRCPFARPH